MLGIHTKRGWIVPVSLVAALVATGVIRRAFGMPKHGAGVDWLARGLILVAAAVIHVLGERWRRRDGAFVWDARREKLVHLPAGHTFFWIDVHVWPWILLGAWAATLVLSY